VDLFGPTTYASLGTKKHCLVIVDDYLKYTWVYFLKKKDETQQIFIDFATEDEGLRRDESPKLSDVPPSRPQRSSMSRKRNEAAAPSSVSTACTSVKL
jgi:hypothetical protein